MDACDGSAEDSGELIETVVVDFACKTERLLGPSANVRISIVQRALEMTIVTNSCWFVWPKVMSLQNKRRVGQRKYAKAERKASKRQVARGCSFPIVF